MIEGLSASSAEPTTKPGNGWADFSGSIRKRSLGVRHLELWAAAVAGLSILGVLVFPARGMLAVGVLIAAAVVPWGIYTTRRQVADLLIVLVLIETVTASWWVANAGENVGGFIRYPLYLLFCLPVAGSVWRSGILPQGGFRDYLLYLVWASASAVYSLLPILSLERVLATLLPFIAITAIAISITCEEDARRAMGVLFAGCGIVVMVNLIALIAVSGDISWHPDPDSGMLRYSGIFTEPNQIGTLMLATVGAGFAYWPIARGWNRALSAIAMGGAILLAVLADSRSPLVGIAAGVALYLVWRWRTRGVLGLLSLIVLFYGAIALIPSAHSYLNRGDVGSFTGRQTAWDFAIRSIKERPFFGYGYEVEGQILQSPYFSGWDDLWTEGAKTSLHNGFMSRAVSMGIPGLLFWLLIIIRPMLSVFRRERDPWSLRSVVLLCLLPAIVLNFTESIGDFRSFTGVEMGLAWALLERERLFARAHLVTRQQTAEESLSPILRGIRTG